MIDLPELSAPDLAALLASRVCHDVISPVGAIRAGFELLDDMPDDPDAMALVRNSTHCAVAKLEFARVAFGSSGSASGGQIDLGTARQVAENFMKFEKADLVWNGERAYTAKGLAKLILNLILVANSSVPRGREIVVDIESLEPEPRVTITARGKPLRVPARFRAFLANEPGQDPVDAQAVQIYYTLLLAREAGLAVTLEAEAEVAVFKVAPA